MTYLSLPTGEATIRFRRCAQAKTGYGDIELDVDLPVYGSTMVEVRSGQILKSFPTPFRSELPSSGCCMAPRTSGVDPDAAEDPAAEIDKTLIHSGPMGDPSFLIRSFLP